MYVTVFSVHLCSLTFQMFGDYASSSCPFTLRFSYSIHFNCHYHFALVCPNFLLFKHYSVFVEFFFNFICFYFILIFLFISSHVCFFSVNYLLSVLLI